MIPAFSFLNTQEGCTLYIKVVNKKCKGVSHETTPYTPEASVSHLSTKANYVGHYLIGHLFSHNIFRSCQAGPTHKVSKREVKNHSRKNDPNKCIFSL